MIINKLLKKKPAKEKKEVCVVAGYLGQVGSAIYEILKESKKFEVFGYDIKKKEKSKITSSDFLHICIPFKEQDKFIKEVEKLVKEFKPKRIIIHSSVLPLTTKGIFQKLKLKIPVCYSPIRGQHDSLKRDILAYQKYFSCLPVEESDIFSEHFIKMGLKPVGYNKNPSELELVKLLDVCQYSILIGWAQEAERILRKFGFKYDSLLRDFQAEHLDFYPDKRADIFPGVAGGNCVTQDAELVQQIFDSDFIKAFLKSNELKKKEL